MDEAVRDDDWNDPGWRAAADAWTTDRLAALGTPVIGPIERFRVRPWSVTHRAPTTAGPRWFKANVTGCRYEAALAVALTGIAPGMTLAPLATDTARGWLLTADAGPTLRATTTAANRIATWTRMLTAYAELQRSTAPHGADLLALGVPDQRPHTLPATLEALLDDPRIRKDVDPAVRDLIPEFGEWCAELAADGIPATIQHDDLHDDNVFDAPSRADQGGGLRFFDWGDAGVAHPFGSLLVALNVMHDTFGGAQDLPYLRDAYLEPWTGLASPATLRRSVTLACRVARVSRAAAWRRALRHAAVPVDDQFRAAPAAWLNELPTPTTV
ncbi:phosphotransferase [Actinoplanes sp. NPDC023714]|uniref:phosphotransferase n=1 Tax=Actinoplanes sp. NPDC023714 TaxID=3154322 RepID=UPI00340F6D0D